LGVRLAANIPPGGELSCLAEGPNSTGAPRPVLTLPARIWPHREAKRGAPPGETNPWRCTMAEVTVTENGPYKVSGPITLTDPAGNEITAIGKTIFLCRCGHSNDKPFCDGSHASSGFDGTLAARNLA
jgi:CDGSH-type Zn-finger protein